MFVCICEKNLFSPPCICYSFSIYVTHPFFVYNLRFSFSHLCASKSEFFIFFMSRGLCLLSFCCLFCFQSIAGQLALEHRQTWHQVESGMPLCPTEYRSKKGVTFMRYRTTVLCDFSQVLNVDIKVRT